MCIGPDHHRDAALAHEGELGRGGVHFRQRLLDAAGVKFHGHAGGGDAVQRALDGGPHPREIPLGGGFVFDEIRVGEGVEQPALGGEGEVFVVKLLVEFHIAGEVEFPVVAHLIVDRAEHMAERHASVEFF